jgi:uncharacterized protein YndB with AHSA1/START domain
MEASGSEVVREIELDAGAEDVWAVVNDPDELAGWVGDEVRSARFDQPQQVGPEDGGRRLSWTWAPDGRESGVELTVIPAGHRTVVRVVETAAHVVETAAHVVERATGGPAIDARATLLADRRAALEAGPALRWADALLTLELWALRSTLAVPA